MAEKVRTRLLVLSDTHAAPPRPEGNQTRAYRYPLPCADVAIHTGDLTMTGRIEEHQAALHLLQSIDAPLKIVIPGNHDLTLDRGYYSVHGHIWGQSPKYTSKQLDDIRDLYTGHEALANGIQYLEEGTRTFRLENGALLTVYASAYTPAFCNWAFAYPRSQNRYGSAEATNPIPVFNDTMSATTTTSATRGRNVDIVMTHGPPKTILDETSRGDEVGCDYLFEAVSRSRPLLHCFGHIHEGWGAIRKDWTHTETTSPASAQPMSSSHEWENTSKPDEKMVVYDIEAAHTDMGVKVDATDLRRGQETLFVNASIMSLRYKPVQSPWIIDLLLDRSSSRGQGIDGGL